MGCKVAFSATRLVPSIIVKQRGPVKQSEHKRRGQISTNGLQGGVQCHPPGALLHCEAAGPCVREEEKKKTRCTNLMDYKKAVPFTRLVPSIIVMHAWHWAEGAEKEEVVRKSDGLQDGVQCHSLVWCPPS